MLDIRTVLAMLAFTSALMSVLLLAGAGPDRSDGFAKWNLGLATMTLSMVLFAARGFVPPAISVAGANAMLFAALSLQAAAVREFSGHRQPYLGIAGLTAAVFVSLLPVRHDFNFFTLVAATALVPALAIVAWRCVSLRAPGTRAVRYFMAGSYAIGAALLAGRAVRIALYPETHGNIFESDRFDTVTFLALFAAIVCGSFGFVVLQRARAEGEVRRLATFDALTDLLNRRGFLKLGERTLAAARRGRRRSAALMLDLDHFKSVNDTFGHAAGDRVLRDFADVLRRSVRPADVLGRYGGEEFCALLPGVTREEALEVAERIRRGAAEACLGELPEPVTVSIGVALVSLPAEGALESALELADKALYEAKAGGRNRVVAVPAPERAKPVARAITARAA